MLLDYFPVPTYTVIIYVYDKYNTLKLQVLAPPFQNTCRLANNFIGSARRVSIMNN
jgi:hypothetical protein